jgi:hypothetical protein
MKFHRRLMLIVGINIVLSFLFSYILDKFEGDHHDHSAVGINMGIGWIFWLGLFTVIAPQILSDEDKSTMFNKQYIIGTFLLLFITLISTIITSYLAAAIVLN